MDKIVNPITGRSILINGATFKKLMKEGVINSKGEPISTTKKSSTKKSSVKNPLQKSHQLRKVQKNYKKKNVQQYHMIMLLNFMIQKKVKN